MKRIKKGDRVRCRKHDRVTLLVDSVDVHDGVVRAAVLVPEGDVATEPYWKANRHYCPSFAELDAEWDVVTD